ncbi:MOSC domain-containing protein [Kribbella speibonae]|uniref:MOSC domain-containing protein n=1 Tax=Kribbella speibonae TaxID=1572660 RepID=A0ABY2AAW4_9ACTN|nr:MOSC domain-containing protein [Kribbella speibonae]TCC26839.1 MOSC domain-containing protein [Kribbella speibonae]
MSTPAAGASTVLSVNVGLPKDVRWQDRTVHTGVWKRPVPGRVMARKLNLDGDGQGDTAGHGGEQRAVLVYQIESYRHWQQHFDRADLEYGSFGENLTVQGLADDEVCIGDRYHIGEAEFEVTQPRVTCYRVGLRLGEPELPALLVSHHRPGFYLRVVREGHLQAGDQIVKTRTGPGSLTVAETDALLYLPNRDLDKLRLATRIPALSPGWQQSFRDLLAARGPAEEPAPAWSGFRQLQVTDVIRESETVSALYLASPDGARLPTARAGQYLTLRMPDGASAGAVRNYSLSSAPLPDHYRISVKHEPHGTVSRYLTTDVEPGAMLDVAAPRGDFVVEDGDGSLVLVSAGIGLTPVLAMLHELARSRSTREIWWLHSARGPRQHPHAEEARALLRSLPQAREYVFYTAASRSELLRAGAHAGRLSKEELVAMAIPPEATAYICGPASFMAQISDALAAVGIDPARIRSELFGASPALRPGLVSRAERAPHQPAGPAGTGPMVTFVRSGLSIAAPARGSLLELAEACDVPARWSCRTGVCHNCVTTVLSGHFSYSPVPLEAPTEGKVLICCATAETDVVLDL